MKNLKSFNQIYFIFLLTIFFFSSVFDRSFVGLQAYGFRLGELVSGLLFIQTIIIMFTSQKNIKNLNLDQFSQLFLFYKLIIVTFVISVIYFDTNILSTYTYKTSTYIWMCSLTFFSYYLFKNYYLKKEYVLKASYIYALLPIVHYVFSSGYYPNFIMNFFNLYSDKFTFTKASDIMIVLVMSNILLLNVLKNKKIALVYFGITVPLLLPLLLEMSRGSFIGAASFLILVIIYNIRYFFVNPKFAIFLIFLSSFSFILSTYRISGIEFNLSQQDNIAIDTSVSGNIAKIALKKDTRKAFFSFYFEDGRIVSDDNTTDWRLDIWQDVIDDLSDKNAIFSGYGYNSIIPVMTDPTAPGRLGRDGLNENVHSYVFNILGRGGIIQLILFAFFHLSFILIWKKHYRNLDILLIMVPVFLNSFTDMNMEGVQFPFMYYFFLGFYFKLYNYKNDLINPNI
jgi:hypothetical protein